MKYFSYTGKNGRIYRVRSRVNEVYGYLTVCAYVGRNGSGQPLWRCTCICGRHTTVASCNLLSNHTQSCGCMQKVGKQTHGMSRHPLYSVWSGMLARCYRTDNTHYQYYGGRGITVCARWHDVRLFIQDMSPRPRGASIERKDNNRGYSRRNCFWATTKTQANNKTTTVRLTYAGETKPVTAWAEELGISAETLRARKRLGWTDEETLTIPMYGRR